MFSHDGGKTWKSVDESVMMQIFLLYFFAALHKTGQDWKDGTASYYALHVDQLATPLGVFIRQYDFLYKPGTYITWWLELLCPLFLIIPFRTSLFKILFIVLMTLVQAGFGSSLRIGLFPWTCIIASLVFLPSITWEKILERIKKSKLSKIKTYYDGDCGFCCKVPC
jgi:hypothetical protein